MIISPLIARLLSPYIWCFDLHVTMGLWRVQDALVSWTNKFLNIIFFVLIFCLVELFAPNPNKCCTQLINQVYMNLTMEQISYVHRELLYQYHLLWQLISRKPKPIELLPCQCSRANAICTVPCGGNLAVWSLLEVRGHFSPGLREILSCYNRYTGR